MGYRKVAPITLSSREGDLGYLAGLIDGEGCIAVTRTAPERIPGAVSVSHSIKVIITNTNRDLIDWLCGMSDTAMAKIRDPNFRPGWKACWNWQISGPNAETFLRTIHPFLRIKRPQADLCLELRDLGRHKWQGRRLDPAVVARREEIFLQVKALNKRGLPEQSTATIS